MSFPARVHIILARNSRSALVIRRGPSKAVCFIGWDRKTDEFTVGQWLKGRIYERRCDLSPDGIHVIYFAMNGKWSSEVKGSWTAISRFPYLKAIGLWANGSCWNGGGLFMQDGSYWLNSFMFGHEAHQLPSSLHQHSDFPFHESYGGECPGVYYIRLQRDGWKLLGHTRDQKDGYSTFRKQLPKGWVIDKIAHATIDHPVGAGCYFDTHALRNEKNECTIDCADWEWAEQDGQRLIWVSKGILYTAGLSASGLARTKMLYDFNPLRFEAIPAPY